MSHGDTTRSGKVVGAAFVFTCLILALGYVAFGFWTSLIFSSGFLGGFLLWLRFGGPEDADRIAAPYWVCLALFILHRVEERFSGFFAELARITGTPTPEIASWPVLALVAVSVGAWLLVLPLVKRRHPFGGYLAWTFFAAMGVTELAHFIFLVIDGRSEAYFPGMASVVFLAPAAWWGMSRMLQHRANAA